MYDELLFLASVSAYLALCYLGFLLVLCTAVFFHYKVKNLITGIIAKYLLVALAFLHVAFCIFSPLWIGEKFSFLKQSQEIRAALVMFGCLIGVFSMWVAARSEVGRKFLALKNY